MIHARSSIYFFPSQNYLHPSRQSFVSNGTDSPSPHIPFLHWYTILRTRALKILLSGSRSSIIGNIIPQNFKSSFHFPSNCRNSKFQVISTDAHATGSRPAVPLSIHRWIHSMDENREPLRFAPFPRRGGKEVHRHGVDTSARRLALNKRSFSRIGAGRAREAKIGYRAMVNSWWQDRGRTGRGKKRSDSDKIRFFRGALFFPSPPCLRISSPPPIIFSSLIPCTHYISGSWIKIRENWSIPFRMGFISEFQSLNKWTSQEEVRGTFKRLEQLNVNNVVS